jgi:nitrogen fixation NifU-like protein
MSYKSDLYQQVILDHNRKPRNFHAMDGATHTCEGFNPLCGDRLTVYLKLDPAGVIDEVSFTGSGCAISKASASMMTSNLKGKTQAQAQEMFGSFHKMLTSEGESVDEERLGKLSIFSGVREYPSRIKCATLAWHTMASALDGSGSTTSD